MGILNATPDSFSDGGRFDACKTAIARAATMIREGADIVDIGGESTRPGAMPVDAEEEMRRVLPVIERVAAGHTIPVSIDTYKAQTADRALAAGARLVNDVWGLQRDPEMARVVAAHGAMVVIMHNRESIDPAIDIVEDMRRWFARSIELAHMAGIADTHILLDPGIGFGKSLQQNLDAIARVDQLRSFGYPIVMGTSRKSFIGQLTETTHDPNARLFGTIGSNVAAVMIGADVIRVHDVRAHVEAMRVTDAIMRARHPLTSTTTRPPPP
ncbi:MAG: dihydropteroate synthase [Gemmatimonadota bacterium]